MISKRFIKRFFCGVTLIALAYPFAHWGGGINGIALDAETKAPIRNASVVANWSTVGFTNVDNGQIHISESKTNAKGEFFIRPWGPRLSTPFVHRENPILFFYGKGYEPIKMQRSEILEKTTESEHRSLLVIYASPILPPRTFHMAGGIGTGHLSYLYEHRPMECAWLDAPLLISLVNADTNPPGVFNVKRPSSFQKILCL